MEKKAKGKILEPTVHFERKRIELPSSDIGKKVMVSELVRTGDKLVDFPEFEKVKEKGYVKSPIHAGSNTHFSPDNSELLATVSGYPRIDLLKLPGDDDTTMIFSVVPLFEIPPGKMSAKIMVCPPVSEVNSLLGQNVNTLLEEAGIEYGVDPEKVEVAQKFIDEGCTDLAEFELAEWLPPGEGIDARVEFYIEIGPIAGQVLEDGSIDFRERRIMVGVNKDQHIATKFPAQPGTPGMNVFGEEVEPEGGTDVVVKVFQDASFNEEDGKVIATNDGILSVVNGREIKVCSNQVIEGDVDYETGNLDSANCITVRGDVQPGFKVKTGGDLEIGGGVMSAHVVSEANVVIKGGVTGKKSTIKAFGDVDMNFIEQGRLEAGGNVVVRKQSYYSKLVAFGDIRLKTDAKLIGESLTAGGCISVGDVGSENSDSATLAAGIDFNRYEEYLGLKKELSRQQDDLIQWIQRYGGSKRSKKIKGMEQEIAGTKLKLLQLNLIPGTGKYSRGGGEDTVEGSSAEDYSEKGGTAIERITIDVQGKVYAGTTLRIGNRKLFLDKTLSKRQFKLSSNKKRIIAAPLNRR